MEKNSSIFTRGVTIGISLIFLVVLGIFGYFRFFYFDTHQALEREAKKVATLVGSIYDTYPQNVIPKGLVSAFITEDTKNPVMYTVECNRDDTFKINVYQPNKISKNVNQIVSSQLDGIKNKCDSDYLKTSTTIQKAGDKTYIVHKETQDQYGEKNNACVVDVKEITNDGIKQVFQVKHNSIKIYDEDEYTTSYFQDFDTDKEAFQTVNKEFQKLGLNDALDEKGVPVIEDSSTEKEGITVLSNLVIDHNKIQFAAINEELVNPAVEVEEETGWKEKVISVLSGQKKDDITPSEEEIEAKKKDDILYVNEMYSKILNESEYPIEAYNWQDGASIYDTSTLGKTKPVAICDINGDDIPELFFMHESGNSFADLEMYTYGYGTVYQLPFDKPVKQFGASGKAILQDMRAASGTTYTVYTNKEKNQLVIFDSIGDESIWSQFTVYNIQPEGLKLEKSVMKEEIFNESNGQNDKLVYEINGTAVDNNTGQAEFEALFKDIDQMIMYSTNGMNLTKLGFEFNEEQDMRLSWKEALRRLLPDYTQMSGEDMIKDTEFVNMDGARTVNTISIDDTLHFEGDWYYSEGYFYQAGCIYNGKFELGEKIDDYTYALKLVDFKINNPKKQPRIDSEYMEYLQYVKFEYLDEVYGIKAGDEFRLYLPGRTMDDIKPSEYDMDRAEYENVALPTSIDTLTLHNTTQNIYFYKK